MASPSSRKKNIDLAKITQFKAAGLSHREIGRALGCSSQNIDQIVKAHKLDIDPERCEDYRDHRADILTLKQADVLENLTEEKLESASAKDLAVIFGVLYDKERLERGQATSNVSLLTTFIEGACDRGGEG